MSDSVSSVSGSLSGSSVPHDSIADSLTQSHTTENVETTDSTAALDHVALKTLGNAAYQRADYAASIDFYTRALEFAESHDAEILDKTILLNNRAAAYLMNSQFNECLIDCNDSIELKRYGNLKAWLRKVSSLEKLEKYEESIETCKLILEEDSNNTIALSSIHRLTELLRIRNEKLKDEMLGKLKDLGNGILGKFGLNTDNFKATKDPNTGNYSLAFQK